MRETSVLETALVQNRQPVSQSRLIGSAREQLLVSAKQPVPGIRVLFLVILLRADEVRDYHLIRRAAFKGAYPAADLGSPR